MLPWQPIFDKLFFSMKKKVPRRNFYAFEVIKLNAPTPPSEEKKAWCRQGL